MTISKLLLPPSHLSACMFAAIYRDTRGVKLHDADRINHFPASPLVSVTLLRRGRLCLFTAGQHWGDPNNLHTLPKISVMGPTDSPISSWSPCAVEAVTFGIYPDAWFQFGGGSDFTNIPKPIQQALDAFAKYDDPEMAWDSFCESLTEPWSNKRSGSWQNITSLSDWARALIIRAALSPKGKSLRTFERRLHRISGLTKRKLDFYQALENAHRILHENPETSAAEIAHDAGYCDQSHMGRAVRRATGFTPAYINNAIKTEEPFWCYRLLGERF